MLVLLIFILTIIARYPVKLLAIITSVVFIIPNISITQADVSDLKLQQLISVFEITSHLNFDILPHSLQVRVAEIKEFNDGPWWQKLFGRGLGGYINITPDFPMHLGPDDYSEQQIASGKITSPHNLGYLLVKFGYVGLSLAMIFIVLIYYSTRRLGVIKAALYITLGVSLLINLGYTMKISFLLGLLLVVIQKLNQFEKMSWLRIKYKYIASCR